ncbi:DUF7844 domain-containing protein [Pseudomonas sp. TTU2014-080ASC]|uniref:DUF7844 domain-containing protein n=1 Tax=Pseudomonas sp. TTU2014-080ASC TaxID=1729724 RepID=UPI000AAD0C3A|nr:DUF4105 domain-containing protein [Pseudomonas sp. TTU2014-080ASC]
MIPSPFRWLALIALLASAGAQARLQLSLDETGLTPEQRDYSQQLLEQAQFTLPPSFVERLDRKVSIIWSDELPADSYGRLNSLHSLLLNARLLPKLLDPLQADADTGRTHGTLRREVLATVLHELTHLYDRSRLWPTQERRLLMRCKRQMATTGPVGLADDCRGQDARRFTLSDAPRFLDLAGWQQYVGRRGAREQNNDQDARSPDLYELTNPREYLAVNMEYFLLDPSYACRRPSMQRYLSKHFGWSPPAQSACADGLPYMNAGRDFAREPLGKLDPERVYEVDYLLAEGNDQWASRWGHSMLRLVVCAPGRPRGPDCRLDLEHHLVLSYRAFVGDVQLSSWDGLTGAYPSRLFVLPLDQVIEEYTKIELRGLASVPLKLTRSETEQMVERAMELHWSYDGDYWFLSNNCAVENLKLLRGGVERPELQTLDSILPNGLLEVLTGRGLADMSVLDDPRKALRLGYRFDSFRDRYQAMFSILRERMAVPQEKVEDWLNLPAKERQRWFGKADLRSGAALLLLEQAALRRQLLLAQEDLKQRYLNARERSGSGFELADDKLRQILDQSGFLSRPAELLESGYGLPQASEWQRLQEQSSERQQRLRRLSDELDHDVRSLLAAQQRDEISAVEANLKELGDHLRELHKAAGGLQLPE